MLVPWAGQREPVGGTEPLLVGGDQERPRALEMHAYRMRWTTPHPQNRPPTSDLPGFGARDGKIEPDH